MVDFKAGMDFCSVFDVCLFACLLFLSNTSKILVLFKKYLRPTLKHTPINHVYGFTGLMFG